MKDKYKVGISFASLVPAQQSPKLTQKGQGSPFEHMLALHRLNDPKWHLEHPEQVEAPVHTIDSDGHVESAFGADVSARRRYLETLSNSCCGD